MQLLYRRQDFSYDYFTPETVPQMIVRIVHESSRIPVGAHLRTTAVELCNFACFRHIHTVAAVAVFVVKISSCKQKRRVIFRNNFLVGDGLFRRIFVHRRADDESNLRHPDFPGVLEEPMGFPGRVDAVLKKHAVEHPQFFVRNAPDDLADFLRPRDRLASEQPPVHRVVIVVAADVDRLQVDQILDLVKPPQPDSVTGDRHLDVVPEDLVDDAHDLVEKPDVGEWLASRDLHSPHDILVLQPAKHRRQLLRVDPLAALGLRRAAEPAVRRAVRDGDDGKLEFDIRRLRTVVDAVRGADVILHPDRLAEDVDDPRPVRGG